MTPPTSRRTVLVAGGAAALPLGWGAPAAAPAPGWRRSPLPELGRGSVAQTAATNLSVWASGWRLAGQVLLRWDGRECAPARSVRSSNGCADPMVRAEGASWQ